MARGSDYRLKTKTGLLIWVVWIAICPDCVKPDDRFQGGEVVPPGMTLRAWDSPFYITHDIIVREEANLVIEPGVEMILSPKVMIAVNGTLTAKVSVHCECVCMFNDVGINKTLLFYAD